MAHYALINQDDTVVQVIVGVDEHVIQIDTDGTEVGGSTQAWEAFYANQPVHTGLYCKRTSYNTIHNQHLDGGTPFRGNYAAIGFKYIAEFDAFIPPKPFSSWKLNYNTFVWEPSIPMPEPIEGHAWRWSELNQEWISVSVSE